MNEIQTPDDLIAEGISEYRQAVPEAQQSLLQMAAAVWKIRQGCDAKAAKGGRGIKSEFPEICMRELGLKQSTAKKLSIIGENEEKLVFMKTSLPADSVFTVYEIARMSPEQIQDKVKRGVIHPGASRAEVLEKKRVEIAVSSAQLEAIKDIEPILKKKLSRTEQAALMKSWKEATQVEVEKAKEEARAQIQMARDKMDAAEKLRAQLAKARRYVNDPFTRAEFQKIRGMLHPDRHPGNEGRAKECYELFGRIEEVCKKKDLAIAK